VSDQLHASAALPLWQNPGTQWTGDWLGPRADMDILKRKKNCSYRESNPDSPARMTVAAPTTHLWLMICRKLFFWRYVDYTDTTICYANEVNRYHGYMAPVYSRFPKLSCSPSI